jgi:hypothetical protein
MVNSVLNSLNAADPTYIMNLAATPMVCVCVCVFVCVCVCVCVCCV